MESTSKPKTKTKLTSCAWSAKGSADLALMCKRAAWGIEIKTTTTTTTHQRRNATPTTTTSIFYDHLLFDYSKRIKPARKRGQTKPHSSYLSPIPNPDPTADLPVSILASLLGCCWELHEPHDLLPANKQIQRKHNSKFTKSLAPFPKTPRREKRNEPTTSKRRATLSKQHQQQQQQRGYAEFVF